MCFIQVLKIKAAEYSNFSIKILHIYSHMYIYVLICKLFLGKGRLKTMKIEIVRKGDRKKEWDLFRVSLRLWRNIKQHHKAVKIGQAGSSQLSTLSASNFNHQSH